MEPVVDCASTPPDKAANKAVANSDRCNDIVPMKTLDRSMMEGKPRPHRLPLARAMGRSQRLAGVRAKTPVTPAKRGWIGNGLAGNARHGGVPVPVSRWDQRRQQHRTATEAPAEWRSAMSGWRITTPSFFAAVRHRNTIQYGRVKHLDV